MAGKVRDYLQSDQFRVSPWPSRSWRVAFANKIDKILWKSLESKKSLLQYKIFIFDFKGHSYTHTHHGNILMLFTHYPAHTDRFLFASCSLTAEETCNAKRPPRCWTTIKSPTSKLLLICLTLTRTRNSLLLICALLWNSWVRIF